MTGQSRECMISTYENRRKVVACPVDLKVVSATFLLVCFLSLKERFYETRKNAFYFTLKALFILKKIKVWSFRYSNFMTSSNV